MSDKILINFQGRDGKWQTIELPIRDGLFEDMKKRIMAALQLEDVKMYWNDQLSFVSLNSPSDMEAAVDYAQIVGRTQQEEPLIDVFFSDKGTLKITNEKQPSPFLANSAVRRPENVEKKTAWTCSLCYCKNGPHHDIRCSICHTRKPRPTISRPAAPSKKDKPLSKDMLFEMWAELKQREKAVEVRERAMEMDEQCVRQMKDEMQGKAEEWADERTILNEKIRFLEEDMDKLRLESATWKDKAEEETEDEPKDFAFERMPSGEEDDSDESCSSEGSHEDLGEDIVDAPIHNENKEESEGSTKNAESNSRCDETNEDRIIANLSNRYSHPDNLYDAVFDCYIFYRDEDIQKTKRHEEALCLVVKAMVGNLTMLNIQYRGATAISALMRRAPVSEQMTKRVVRALVSGAEALIDDALGLLNCLWALSELDHSALVSYDDSRLVRLLVRALQFGYKATSVIAVRILNDLASYADTVAERDLIGELGAIEAVVKYITVNMENSIDDGIEVAWDFLWSLTDETAINCERFLEAAGMSLFNHCIEKFRENNDMIHCMMGVMANIAEVLSLRDQLLNRDFILNILPYRNQEDGNMEISFSVAGILAHLLCEGEDAWKGVADRQFIENTLFEICSQWRINTHLSISFDSLLPFIVLLAANSPASQHWAVWTIANLTTTDSGKYCSNAIEEKGEELLADLAASNVRAETKELATIARLNINAWMIDNY